MVCDRSGVRRRTGGWLRDGVGNQREREKGSGREKRERERGGRRKRERKGQGDRESEETSWRKGGGRMETYSYRRATRWGGGRGTVRSEGTDKDGG